MPKFEEKFYGILAEYLRGLEPGLDVDRVTGFEDKTYTGGYCETCWYEVQRATIYYINTSGGENYFEYWGSFSELLGELLETEVE